MACCPFHSIRPCLLFFLSEILLFASFFSSAAARKTLQEGKDYVLFFPLMSPLSLFVKNCMFLVMSIFRYMPWV